MLVLLMEELEALVLLRLFLAVPFIMLVAAVVLHIEAVAAVREDIVLLQDLQ